MLISPIFITPPPLFVFFNRGIVNQRRSATVWTQRMGCVPVLVPIFPSRVWMDRSIRSSYSRMTHRLRPGLIAKVDCVELTSYRDGNKTAIWVRDAGERMAAIGSLSDPRWPTSGESWLSYGLDARTSGTSRLTCLSVRPSVCLFVCLFV